MVLIVTITIPALTPPLFVSRNPVPTIVLQCVAKVIDSTLLTNYLNTPIKTMISFDTLVWLFFSLRVCTTAVVRCLEGSCAIVIADGRFLAAERLMTLLCCFIYLALRQCIVHHYYFFCHLTTCSAYTNHNHTIHLYTKRVTRIQ